MNCLFPRSNPVGSRPPPCAPGRENATALWRELQDLGCAGSPKQVYRWMAEHRTAPAKTTARKWRSPGPSRSAADASLPSPKQLAWLLGRPPTALDATEAAVLARVRRSRGCDYGRTRRALLRPHSSVVS
ncbi:hypothetical protein DC522_32800 [Microvirga sp. KLBC 81]|nr:hypothetical protein DC522_32800 [Microvirga sp. KLBC 81]